MRHVLLGTAVALGLVTSFCGWRWVLKYRGTKPASNDASSMTHGTYNLKPDSTAGVGTKGSSFPTTSPLLTDAGSLLDTTTGSAKAVIPESGILPSTTYRQTVSNITTPHPTDQRIANHSTTNYSATTHPTANHLTGSHSITNYSSTNDSTSTLYDLGEANTSQNGFQLTTLLTITTEDSIPTTIQLSEELTNATSKENNYGYENISKNSSQPINSTDDDIDYVNMGQELLIDATTILDTGIWDFEKRTEDGDAIFSRQLDNGNMVYRLTGIVDMPAQDLLVIIYDGLADYPKWNPSLLECRVLEKINDQTDISYTVSAPGARGYVVSRDFVSLRHWDMHHNTYVAASKSIDFLGAPSNPDYIRGRNGPGCMELRPLSSDQSKTEFRWLLNTKLNGWIPSYIADKAYKKFMTKYMVFLRDYCKKLKQRAFDFTLPSTTPKNFTN